MAVSHDILLDKNNDLLVIDGDFSIGNSEQQETNLLLNTFVGNWFQYPLVGLGIINYLAGNENALVIEQLIKKQMENDGFIVENISIKGSTLENFNITVLAHR